MSASRGDRSVTGTQGNPLDAVAGNALVHTNYFEDEDVLAMIAWHIARASGEQANVALRPELVNWLEATSNH